jgi:hypothetical protein
MRHEAGATTADKTAVEKTLLLCGVIASVLYPIIDLLAGLNYQGYSFYSQTISELGAIGAPKPVWLAPLFLTYSVLMLVFAIGVVAYGRGRNEKVVSTGFLLLLYMIVGSGTAVFPIHVRGTATLSEEMPHIVAGLAATTIMLIAMAVGSTAFGKRFRNFSYMMFASTIVFGALTVPFGVKLAAGEPTPGIGVVERLAYYSMIVWIAGLSLALVQRHEGRLPT